MSDTFEKINIYEQKLKIKPAVSTYVKLSTLYLDQKQFELAYSTILKLIQFSPDNINGVIVLAKYYKDVNQFEKCFDLLKLNIKTNKLNFKLLKLYLEISVLLEQKKEISKVCKMILFLNPKDEEALKFIAQKNIETIVEDDWKLYDTSKLPNLVSDNVRPRRSEFNKSIIKRKINVLRDLQNLITVAG